MTDDPSKKPEEILVEWIRKNAERGRRAFSELAGRHSNWLAGVLRSMLPPDGADEVAQQSLLAAYVGFDGFSGSSSFKSWLRGIATRQAFQWHRRRSVEKKYAHKVELAPPTDRSHARSEEQEAILEVLSSLEYIHREVLVFRYFEELTIREISELLELGESAVKMRLKRARDVFRVRYGEVTDG